MGGLVLTMDRCICFSSRFNSNALQNKTPKQRIIWHVICGGIIGWLHPRALYKETCLLYFFIANKKRQKGKKRLKCEENVFNLESLDFFELNNVIIRKAWNSKWFIFFKFYEKKIKKNCKKSFALSEKLIPIKSFRLVSVKEGRDEGRKTQTEINFCTETSLFFFFIPFRLPLLLRILTVFLSPTLSSSSFLK